MTERLDDMLRKFIVRFLKFCDVNDIKICHKMTRDNYITWEPLDDIIHNPTNDIIDLFLKRKEWDGFWEDEG
jgi:hypothetical protein